MPLFDGAFAAGADYLDWRSPGLRVPATLAIDT